MMKNYQIRINKKIINNQTKPFLIAEVAQAHQGNIKKVYKFIDAISKLKIDAIKFQTHLAEFESTYDEPFRLKVKNFSNRFNYWKTMEFSQNDWLKIKRYCNKKNIIFLTSVFSIESVKLLSKLKLNTWKLGSGEAYSYDLLNYLRNNKKNNSLLISTGLMNNKRINEIYRFFYRSNPLCIMHCVSKYPSKFNELGFNNIDFLNKKYKCLIGYSDHTGSIYSILYAISQSIPVIEFHVKIDENKKNLDRTSSINIKDLELIANANEIFYQIRKSKINKSALSKSQIKMLKIFGKSLSFKEDMLKGNIITKENLTLKKPGTGIKFKDMKKILGKKLIRNISKRRLIKKKDLV